jgi:hypothetical protein
MEEVTEAQHTPADRQPSAYGLRRRWNLERRQIHLRHVGVLEPAHLRIQSL